MNRIVEKAELAANIKQMVVEAPLVARKAKPGQFIILRVSPEGERIPLTIAGADPDRGTVTIIFQEVGATTRKLGALNAGDGILNFVGPLGQPVEIEKFGTVCIVVGGVGAAFVYWMALAFRAKGNHLISILGARTRDLIILEEQMRGISNEFFLTTDDGSQGTKGFVTDVLGDLLSGGRAMDYVLTAGPIPMMKRVAEVTRPYGIKTVASLNPVMVDGTGMCGGCRVTVGGKVKFACVDGPDFDAHQVDFDELFRRTGLFKPQEAESAKRCESCVLQRAIP